MNIIVDTNILRRDLKLKDKNFEIITDYLKKTNSKIILPQIVLEEIQGLYKRALIKIIDEFKKSHEKLQTTLSISKLENLKETKEIDIDSEVSAYLSFLYSRLKIREENIIKYKNDYLPELVKRAIDRKKPLGDKGQQFRDGLLWLTILDYTKEQSEKRVIFISGDPADFSEKGQNILSLQLQQEAKDKGVEIIYYKSISDFVKGQASKVEFITDEWIKANLDFSFFERIFNEVIKKEENYLLATFEKNLGRDEHLTGYINDTSYIQTNLIDYYVYEKVDGTILLNIEIEFEKEYELEIEEEIERNEFDYGPRINPRIGKLEIELVFVPRLEHTTEYNHKYEYPLFRGEFVLTIKDKKIVDCEFEGWDWG